MINSHMIEAKEKMIAEHLRGRDIKDEAVLNAFMEVPREEFIPARLHDLAYEDHPLDIGEGQTISQPYTVAFMTQLLEPKEGDVVLEVGTGSGYQSAILSRIVKKVYTIERFEELAEKARKVHEKLGYKNIKVAVGDGSLGLPGKAPFDAIIVTAGAPKIPDPLIKQLKIDGTMVIPVGTYFQEMIKITKTNGGLKKKIFPGFRFVPLVGQEGFKE